MEGLIHGNKFVIFGIILVVRVFPGYFKRPLNGFCSAVGEKYFFHFGSFHDFFGSFYRRNIVEKIGCVNQPIDLLLQLIIIILISISKSEYCDSGSKVKVFLAFHVI